MAWKAPRRRTSLILALTLMTTMVIAGSVATSSADGALPDTSDQIVLTIEPGTARFTYGPSTQQITTGSSECNGALASSDAIMTASTEAPNKQGTAVVGKLGLVDNGLGSNLKGNGNAQECGRVDVEESLTLMLGTGIGSRLISSAVFDFEAKFDAEVKVEYLKSDGTAFNTFDTFDLTENGSDSGPDSKNNAKYKREGPVDPALEGILFSGVRISTISGSVSLEGGADWPVPADHRTVFNLVSVLGCGEGAFDGGPAETDDPDAAFVLGPPSKDGVDCLVPISITTENNTGDGGFQTVEVGAPTGYTWAGLGVTGLLTIEWDIEAHTDDGVGRSEVSVDGTFEVIPWCEDVVNIQKATGSWYFDLLANDSPEIGDDPLLYPMAVPDGVPLCLVRQSTENVEYEDDVYTQTTEVFYLFEDPLVRR